MNARMELVVPESAELVRLTEQECHVAGNVGMRRHIEATLKNRKPRFAERVVGELFGHHILSAMAELAVAKYLGRYWSFHENKFTSGDVANIEVRFSNSRKDLKVRQRDNGIVVAVRGYCPTFEIIGWVQAEKIKQPKYMDAPVPEAPPAYFVPYSELHHPRSLISVMGK